MATFNPQYASVAPQKQTSVAPVWATPTAVGESPATKPVERNSLADSLSTQAYDTLKMLQAANKSGAIKNNDYNSMVMEILTGNTKQKELDTAEERRVTQENAARALLQEKYNTAKAIGDTAEMKRLALQLASSETKAQVANLKQRAPTQDERYGAQIKSILKDPLGVFNLPNYLKTQSEAYNDPYGSQGVAFGDNGTLTLGNVFNSLIGKTDPNQQAAGDLAALYRTDAGSGPWYPGNAQINAQPQNNGFLQYDKNGNVIQ